MHMFTEPFYSASKAAVVSTVRCLGPLRRIAGIRNAALCPGAVRVGAALLPSSWWTLPFIPCADAALRRP